MSAPFTVSHLDHAADRRGADRTRYVGIPAQNKRGNLYAFCVEILGYDALLESFHGPMLAEWDRIDLARFRRYEGLDAIDDEPLDTLDLWQRGGIKTWCERARVIRYYLWNAGATVTWWHAVEEKAIESGASIAEQLIKNDKLRALFEPSVLPAKNAAKFFTAGKFTLKSGRRIGESASFVAMGAGGEGTGGHSLVGVLDDFVGQNDVFDNQMHKKLQFYESTVRNVVLRTNKIQGWVDCIGTHWSMDDPYVKWRESPDWNIRVRAALEADGKPDLNGKPTYVSREQIEKERRAQPGAFSFQMMNDPSPSGEKPWIPAECEHYCTLKEAEGEGTVVILSDPAPRAIGSVGGRDERSRKDGTKNWWATVAVKLRRKGDLKQIIWLDAEQSKDWGLDTGMEKVIGMARKWRSRLAYAEHTSTPVYCERLVQAKQDAGWKGHVIGSRRKDDADDKLRQTYNAGAKNAYLVALCDRARQMEFLICESVPAPMVEAFFRQIRGFMPLPDGRTGIPFDDLINALAFATDPYFASRYPQISEEFSWTPFRSLEVPESEAGSRHVRW